MTLLEFAQEYKAMRDLQKEYFKTRSQSILSHSKSAEKELDRKAKEIINGNDNQLFAQL